MRLGEIINKHRVNKKITMDEFAEKSDLSKSYVSMLEKGVHPRNNKPIVPSILTIEKVAKGMGMSFTELFDMLGDNEYVRINNDETEVSPEARLIARRVDQTQGKNREKLLKLIDNTIDTMLDEEGDDEEI